MHSPATPGLDAIEARLRDLLPRTCLAPLRKRGRPPILPAALLWSALLVCLLRGWTSQRALWRLVHAHGLWDFPAQPISDDAIYKRLERDGDAPMHQLLRDVTGVLLTNDPAEPTLAPFATEVVVIDETTLDAVARSVPLLRGAPAGDPILLPGKLAAVFDVRRQLYRDVRFTPHPRQNERVLAPSLVADLPRHSLILADLGSFGFAWFDDLTDAHYWWLSRLRAKTSYTVVHILYQAGDVLDALVWLGAHRADRAKHLVRLIQIPHGQTVHRYVTNVRDPRLLPLDAVGPLYARRWDIEMAFNLIKTELGLHLLWSAKPAVLLIQVWATLLIAQVALSLRNEVARQAEVDVFDVSLPLLVRELPQFAAAGAADPLARFLQVGRVLGYIRDSRRLRWEVPTVPIEAILWPPPDLVTEREPRYAGRRCAHDGSDRRPR